MNQTKLGNLFLDQSKDLFWMINIDLELIYANKSFLRLTREVTGKDKKLNESVFSDGFDESQNKKWQGYYSRALKGEYFEVEDQSYHALSNEVRFGQNTFEPLVGDDQKVFAVACHSKDITRIVKQRSEVDLQREQRIQALVKEGSDLNRKKLENDLNDLNHLFNSIPNIICIFDFKGRFLKINKSGCDVLGYGEESLIYHNFKEFSHPDDDKIFENQVLSLENKENIFTLETRCITSKGDIVWLKWYCNCTLNEGLVYASASNITKEKKLLELNRESRVMAKIGSWEINLDNQNVFWSEEVHKLHETDSETFIPNFENGLNFFRKDFHSSMELSFQKCISKGEQFDSELVIITAKNNERWVRMYGSAEFENGKCKRIYGSLQDINDHKEPEIRLQSLADNLPGVVYQYILYPDGTDQVKYVSKGAQDVLGFSTEEVLNNLNLVWDRIEVAGELESLKKTIADSIKSKNKWTARWKYIMPNGETRNHFGSGSPKFLTNGTIIFNSLILDVTQEAINEVLLEQYNYELERSNEELEKFAFVASHDLQEPLRMISSFMNLLKRKYGDRIDEKGHQYIHFATDGANRMKQIILDLLEYSRVNKSIEGKEDVDLNKVISEFKQLRRKMISEKSASVISDNLPIIFIYKAAISQIINCLLDNALKYTEPGTPPIVEFTVSENEKEWTFSIKDNGIGIAPQFQDKIFTVFQRLHSSDEYDGTGMGLSIAKKQVELLGGSIWLEPTSEKGSLFNFMIPKIR